MTRAKMQQFCLRSSENKSTYSLSSPWVRSGKMYATDGRIMLRVDTNEPDTTGDNPPPIHLVPFEAVYDAPIAIPLLADLAPLVERCGTCQRGRHDCTCGHSHTCGKCGGSYWIETDAVSAVGPVLLADKYLWMLRSIEVTKIQPAAVSPAKQPVYFRGNGFDGVLMPCDPGRR